MKSTIKTLEKHIKSLIIEKRVWKDDVELSSKIQKEIQEYEDLLQIVKETTPEQTRIDFMNIVNTLRS
jgi:hypothetical protein